MLHSSVIKIETSVVRVGVGDASAQEVKSTKSVGRR